MVNSLGSPHAETSSYILVMEMITCCPLTAPLDTGELCSEAPVPAVRLCGPWPLAVAAWPATDLAAVGH